MGIGTPTGHGASVVAAVLDLCVGIGAFAVVAEPGGADELEGLIDHAVGEHEAGDGVFQTGPDFGRVGDGNCGTGSTGEVEDHQAGLVVEGVDALGIGVMGEAGHEVVAMDGGEGRAHVGGVEEIAEAGYGGHLLADELIGETAVAELVVGVHGVACAGAVEQAAGDLIARNAAHLLDVVLAVEEMGVDPAAAFVGHAGALCGEVGLVHGLRHLGHGAQGGQVPGGAHGVGAVELDVVGVVLDAIHDTGLGLVPPAGPPGVGEGTFGGGPLAAEPVVVVGEGPVVVELDDLAHLAVGGCRAPVLFAEGELVAEVHVAFGVGAVAEVGLAHGAGQRGEEELRGHFVVPDMTAGAEAETAAVTAALEGVEAAVGDAEAGVGDEGGEIGAGCVLDFGGEGGLHERGDEGSGVFFEVGEILGGVRGCGPGVGETGAVVVAEAGVFFTLRSLPADGFWGAVGEAPGDQETEGTRGVGGDGLADGDGSYGC